MMGFYESRLAAVLIYLLERFFEQHNQGVVTGPDGTVRLAPGLVRIPDVAFFSWERFPNRQRPAQRVPALVPDLAVEVLSEGNTEAEMEGKLNEYFSTGVRLVWYVDPEPRTVRVYTSPAEFRLLTEEDTLEGGAVLPGFRLPIREWFERAWRPDSP
jgi:Uma2 family endonuclease